MRPKLFAIATIFVTLVGSAPAPSPLLIRDDEKDPTDLSFIHKIAAIGDSYSAGIGAGDRLQNVVSGIISSIIPFLGDDWKCSRYSRSYPFTINRILFGDKRDNFQFLSCSGALADEVTDGQVPSLEGDKDLILVSAGGNDAELVWILNHCVFQFFSPTELAMNGIELAVDSALTAVGEPEIAPAVNLFIQYHKEKLTRGCDQQLAVTESIIKSDAFTKRIERLIEKTKQKLKRDTGTLVYTGYARFWDPDIVDNDYCSKKDNSWSMFYNFDDPTKLLSDKAFLTKDRRDKMNSLVDLMNKRLEEIVKTKSTKNSKGQDDAIFVNYDQYYGDVDGRFCTKGVNKPEKDRTADLTFYPLDFLDPFGSKNFKRSEAVEVYNGTFEAHVDFLAVLADAKGLHYRTEIPKVKAKAKTLGAGSDEEGAMIKGADDNMSHLRKRSILPDGFGRTFHPTIAGHDIIARLILWKLSDRNAKVIGRSFGPEVGSAISDSCPAPGANLPQLSAKCTGSNGASSGLPANVFYHAQDKKGIFDEFCKQIDEKKLDDNSPHKWTVNAKGEKQSGQSKRKRTPPPNPNAYKQIINLEWVPNKNNHNCRASCSQAFQNMAQSGCGTLGGQQNVMAVKAKFDNGCGTFNYEITGQGVPEAEPASCYNDPVYAPKGDREVENGKGTSVEAAYKKFCEDNDGKTLEAPVGSDLIAQRHDITSWGVQGRASFWLRASFIQGCDGKVTISKNECLEKMGRGLGHCEVNSGFTHGFQASGECVNYAVQTTYSTREHGAPWNPGAVKPSWPPPENVDDKKPGCAKAPSPKLSDEDLNKAIDYFCQDGKPYKDSDTLLDVGKIYPPQDQPGFYAKEGKSYRLIMMAIKLTQSDPQRYKDMAWCKNYDWKMGKDDCTYALRKLHHQCVDDKGGLLGGDFIYRCVNYRSWSDNF